MQKLILQAKCQCAYFVGVPCDIDSVTATEITCVTGPSPPDAEYYPGNVIWCLLRYIPTTYVQLVLLPCLCCDFPEITRINTFHLYGVYVYIYVVRVLQQKHTTIILIVY